MCDPKVSLGGTKKLILDDTMNILAIHLKTFVNYAKLIGISAEKLEEIIDYPLPDFSDPALTISSNDFIHVVGSITELSKDDRLGIRVGNHLNLNTLGAIFKISLKSTTVQEALFYCQDYLSRTLPLITTLNSFSEKAASITLSADNITPQVARVILETMLTVITREIKLLSGENTFIEITSPFYSSEYPKGWKKGNVFSVNFHQTILKASLQNNKGWGLDVLIPEYLSLIETVQPDQSFSGKIRSISLNIANPILPDIHIVSDALNLTPRTLQRRLRVEGNSFTLIMENLKTEIAGFLIRHNQFSINNISYLLGYSESAAFIHFFKKMHGSSPKKIREKLLKGALILENE